MDDMIRNKNALKQEIDSLKQTLSKQVKKNESLLQTFTVFKKESKEKENKYMDKEIKLEKKIKELDNIVYKVGQSAQTVHMLTKPQVFYDDTHKQAHGYQNPFYLKKAHRIKPTLYDGIVISKKHDVIYVVDEEKTLILEEESRSKMLAKQNDRISKEKKINISPINYSELNKLSKYFGKRFVPQKELSVEQAFWLQISNPISEQPVVQTAPVRTKAPSELPKVSMVKTIFNQMEAVVEQCSVDKKYFDIQKKEIFLDNDRLLEHIICQDVMNIVMHADFILVNVLLANNKFHICVNSLATLTNYAKIEQDYIDEYNENLVLKTELATKKEHVVKEKFLMKSYPDVHDLKIAVLFLNLNYNTKKKVF
ncbi:hypothetical protein Tco_0134439 [Tanacetum coccineum]